MFVQALEASLRAHDRLIPNISVYLAQFSAVSLWGWIQILHLSSYTAALFAIYHLLPTAYRPCALCFIFRLQYSQQIGAGGRWKTRRALTATEMPWDSS
jgi:hypothetical protein